MAKHRKPKPKRLNLLMVIGPLFLALLFISSLVTINDVYPDKPIAAAPPPAIVETITPPEITTATPLPIPSAEPENVTTAPSEPTISPIPPGVESNNNVNPPATAPIPPTNNPPPLPVPPVANKPLLSLDNGVELNVPLVLADVEVDLNEQGLDLKLGK